MKKTYEFKVLAIGDCGVGKTSLLIRFAKGVFPDLIEAHDVLTKTTTVDNTKLSLKIWDTAGQERFNTITSTFYRGAHIILIAFDLTNQQSFDNLQQWILEVDRYANETSARIIVGTKSDLNSERIISKDAVNQFCSNKGLQYVETSAKTGDLVEEAFTNVCREFLDQIKNGHVDFDEND